MSTYSPLISQKVKFHGNLPLSQQNRGQLGYSQVIADFSHTPTSVQQMKVVENSQISSKLVKPPPIRFDMLELLLREKEATSFEEIKVQVKNSLPKFRRKKLSSKPNSIQTSIRSVDGVMVENKKRKQKSSKIPFTTEISKLLSQQTGTSKSTIEQNEESKKGKPVSAIFEENKQFIRDVQLEIDLIFANQIINEMNYDIQGLDEEEIAQKNETINALREMNDLWATRLDELNQQAYDIEEEKVINLMKQGTKEDKALFKKLCDEKPELKQAQLQYLKLQQIISAQKVEKGLVKSRIDSYKNDPDKVDLINRVKELEKINAELEYREKKLYKFNQDQFKAVHREAIEPSAVQRQEIVELEEMITNYKSKHKLLLGFKAKQDKMANIRFNNIQKQKTLNNELQAEVIRLAKQGFQVAQIQFQTNRSRERQLALSPAPLPIQLEVERNRKKEPKKYDSSAVIQLNEKERDRLQLSVKRQEAQILAFQNEIAETKKALKMHEYYLTDVTLRYQSIQNEAMKNQILVKSQRHKSVKTSLRPSQSQNISLQQIQEETPPLQLQDSSKIIARIKRQRNALNLKLSKSQNNRLKKKQEKSPPSNKQTTFLTMPDQESSEEDFYKLPSERGNDFYSENLIKIEQNDNFYSLAHDRSLSKISLKKPTLTGKNNQNYIQKPGYNSEQPLQALNSAYTPNLPPSKNTISTDIDLRNIRINPLRQSVSVVGKGPGLISELPPIAPKGRNNMIEGPKLRVSMSRDVYNPYESRSKK